MWFYGKTVEKSGYKNAKVFFRIYCSLNSVSKERLYSYSGRMDLLRYNPWKTRNPLQYIICKTEVELSISMISKLDLSTEVVFLSTVPSRFSYVLCRQKKDYLLLPV